MAVTQNIGLMELVLMLCCCGGPVVILIGVGIYLYFDKKKKDEKAAQQAQEAQTVDTVGNVVVEGTVTGVDDEPVPPPNPFDASP